MFSKISPAINLMYYGQQFSYIKKLVNSIPVHEFHIFLAKNIWPKDILTERHLSCRKLTNGHWADRRLATKHLATKHLANRHFVNRHLANRYLANIHLATKHLGNRHLVNRHLTDRHLEKGI